MSFRVVPSTSQIQTPADAEAFIIQDTDGAVMPTGVTQPVNGGWRVEVYSLDGMPSPPVPAWLQQSVIALSWPPRRPNCPHRSQGLGVQDSERVSKAY
jgi:hypothetical protein